MTLRTLVAALGMVACTTTQPGPTTNTDGNTDDGTTNTANTGEPSDTATEGCTYPDAVEPMALNEVLFPYRWPNALHRDGRTGEVRLREVYCDDDEDIDWSPFDVLVFVSIPAW